MRSIAIIPRPQRLQGPADKKHRPLNGKPLLAYSIEAALASGLFDTVHVSTDSERYADIARQYGADEPVPPQRRDLLRHRLLRGRHSGGAAPLRGNGTAL